MYQLTAGTEILRLIDSAYIPADPDNTDYQNYQQWLDDGNTPEPAPPAPAPPTAAEKLAAAGLTVEDLRGLLGIS